ncbi:MAG: PEP-CTERM sorting domain-containing protein [Planctomycetes bacterium]|nr:PEP-CTERM sorting domain-containing protein [Planctomycetota bacterium]
MKHLLALLIVLALIAVPANAQAIRLFLAEEDGTPALVNPSVDTSGGDVTLYLWAEMVNPGGNVAYNSVGFNIRVDGGAQVTGGSLYNITLPSWTSRWDSTVFTGTYPTSYAKTYKPFYVGTLAPPRGVTNNYGTADPDYRNIGGREFNLLGEFTFSGLGEVFLEVGLNGIVRATAGIAEPVYMGFGDEGDGLMGNSFDQGSSIAEASLVPEPASLLLLGLGALALRRR